MPIMVVFDPVEPKTEAMEFGPYRWASVNDGLLTVAEGVEMFDLARCDASGQWSVNGLEGLAFIAVRFLPPPDERRADLAAEGIPI